MVTLSIGIVMAVIMCSYDFELGDRWAERNRNVDDDIWYEADIMTEGDRDIEARIMTAKGCRTIIEYYERMTSSSDWSTLSVNTYQDLFARERDYVDYLGDRDFTSFQTEYQPGAFGATFGAEHCSVVDLLRSEV